MGHVIVVTGASSGFGRLSAEAPALAGHNTWPDSPRLNGSHGCRNRRYVTWPTEVG
jgi:NAD(P)-dependent dehydrogenase (short-subunit alcohol dehydrogenase family)